MTWKGLEMRGRLIPQLFGADALAWRQTNGIEVSIVGGQDVTLRWAGKDDEPEMWGYMTAALEPWSLALTMRTGHAIRIEWRERVVHRIDGTQRVRVQADATAGVLIELPLPSEVPEIAAFDSDPVLVFASDMYRDGVVLAEIDERAAAGRLYLACELIVHAVAGKATRGTWKETAVVLSLVPEDVMGLYHSLQTRRHVNASDARRELGKMRRDPDHLRGMMEGVRAVLNAYLRWSTKT